MQGSKIAPKFQQWASDIHSRYKHSDYTNFCGKIYDLLGLVRRDSLDSRLFFATSYAPPNYLCAVCAFGFSSLIKDLELSSVDCNQPLSRIIISRDVMGPWRDCSDTLLDIASREGHYDVVQILLKCAADVNVEAPPSLRTALVQASWRGHDTIVRLLLEKGAAVEEHDEYLNAGLHLASPKGH